MQKTDIIFTTSNSFPPALFRAIILAGVIGQLTLFSTGLLRNHTYVCWFVAIWLIIRGRSLLSASYLVQIASLAAFAWTLSELKTGTAGIVCVSHFAELIMLLQWLILDSAYEAKKALLLSITLVIATAAMSINFIFPVIFAVYFTCVAITLNALAIYEQIKTTCGEALSIQDISCFRFIVSADYWLFAVRRAFAFVFLFILLFYLFPRSESRGISQGVRQNKILGFSGSLKIGSGGLTQDNPMVVMRIRPMSLMALSFSHINRIKGLLLRGTSFVSYRQGKWIREGYRRFLFPIAVPGQPCRLPSVKKLPGIEISLEIFLEHLDPPILFLPERTYELSIGSEYIQYYQDNSISFVGKRQGTDVYIATTVMDRPDLADESLYNIDNPTWPDGLELAPFLDTGDAPDIIAEIAHGIASSSQPVLEKVNAVQNYLQSYCQYSLEEKSQGNMDPTAYFLLFSRQGSCEHFASAMTIMLRSLGVPARPVNGYTMGDWNGFGGFFTVRQRHAHAWVEVYFDGLGWLSVDPTPATEFLSSSNELVTFVNTLWERVEGTWFKYVYRFDGKIQRDGLKKIRGNFASYLNFISNHIEFAFLKLFLILSGLFLIPGIIFILKRKSGLKNKTRNRMGWIPAWYKAWSDKIPLKRRIWETPREFHTRLVESGVMSSDLKSELELLGDLIDEEAFGAHRKDACEQGMAVIAAIEKKISAVKI